MVTNPKVIAVKHTCRLFLLPKHRFCAIVKVEHAFLVSAFHRKTPIAQHQKVSHIESGSTLDWLWRDLSKGEGLEELRRQGCFTDQNVEGVNPKPSNPNPNRKPRVNHNPQTRNRTSEPPRVNPKSESQPRGILKSETEPLNPAPRTLHPARSTATPKPRTLNPQIPHPKPI